MAKALNIHFVCKRAELPELINGKSNYLEKDSITGKKLINF